MASAVTKAEMEDNPVSGAICARAAIACPVWDINKTFRVRANSDGSDDAVIKKVCNVASHPCDSVPCLDKYTNCCKNISLCAVLGDTVHVEACVVPIQVSPATIFLHSTVSLITEESDITIKGLIANLVEVNEKSGNVNGKTISSIPVQIERTQLITGESTVGSFDLSGPYTLAAMYQIHVVVDYKNDIGESKSITLVEPLNITCPCIDDDNQIEVIDSYKVNDEERVVPLTVTGLESCVPLPLVNIPIQVGRGSRGSSPLKRKNW